MENGNQSISKTLPMCYPPPITAYPSHANLLSVIWNYEEVKPWFYNGYIQLEAPTGNIGLRLDFYTTLLYKTCPWIYYQRISRELIAKKWDSIIDFIIDSINEGYYVYLLVDRYFVSSYPDYGKGHARHDIFIYGYDLEKKIFQVADCFLNGKYYYSQAEFSQIEEGYNHISAADDWMDGIELIRYRKKYGYTFDFDLMCTFLEDYLNSRNTSQRFKIPSEYWCDGLHRSTFIYGLDVYDFVRDCVEKPFDSIGGPDIRAFHVIWNHKTVMCSRIKFLGENQYLPDADTFYKAYQELARHALVTRNLCLRHHVSKDTSRNKTIQSRITELAANEREVLVKMLDCLKNR